jgi:hypothetical protein
VPLRLFRDRRFVAANAMTVVLYAALTGSLFLLPFVLMDTYGYSAAAAGAAFLPLSAIMAAGNLATASGYAVFALSAARPEYWPGSRLAWCRPESAWSRVLRRLRQWSWTPLRATWVVPRLGGQCGLVAVVEAYQCVMWTAAALTVAAALTAIAWLGE